MKKIKNNGEDRYGFTNLDTGEIIHELADNETARIANDKETKKNKYWSPPIKINKNKGFAKCMIDKLDELVEILKKSGSTFVALNILVLNIDPADNLVKKSDKSKFEQKDLCLKMEITRQQAYNHFKKLKELNLVAEVKMQNGVYYAVNPYYYCRNCEIPERVLNAFDTTKNPPKPPKEDN